MGALAKHIMTSATIIFPGTEWEQVRSTFSDLGLDDIYYDPRYVSLYTQRQAQPEAFVFRDDGEIFWFPYLRRKVGISPFDSHYDFESAYGYGGPVASTTDPEFLGRAWQTFRAKARESKLIAGFIRFHPLLETDRFATNSPVEVIQDRTTVRLTLNKTLDQVWKTYSRDNREKIKKSQKAGVSVSIQGNLETLMAFSKFYLQRMSELQADDEYFFDEEYFRGIAELGPSAYRVYLAFHKEKFIGGALILLSRRFIHYHLSATPREFQKLGTNNRLRHEVICDFLETDYEQIHFGGGRTAAKDDSLLAFKKKFSSETAPYCVGTCVLNSEVYRRVVETWRQTNHEKVDRFGNRVLCYHY
jgi:hypothetical protein